MRVRKQNAAILADSFARAQAPSRDWDLKEKPGQGRGRRIGKRLDVRTSLAKDQGAYCNEKGHWKNECPKRQSNWVPIPTTTPVPGERGLKTDGDRGLKK